MRRVRQHLTFANVVSVIALFAALGGGTAFALNGHDTVQSDDLGPAAQVKAPDVADDAVRGADVKDGSLGLTDLNTGSRPHKLEFSSRTDTGTKTLATIGNVQVSASCVISPALFVTLKNVSPNTGTMNVMLTQQASSNGGVGLFTSGQFVGSGDSFTVDRNDDTIGRAIADGDFSRAEGQIVFQTPGRVTTIDFHAFTTSNGGARCEFYGTAVTANQS
jgi:hypothetical protein